MINFECHYFFYLYKEWRSSNLLAKDEKSRDVVEPLKVAGPRKRPPRDEATVGNRVANVPFPFFNLFKVYMIKAVFVEFIGTLLFLYVIIATGNFAAIGAALAFVIYLGGPISGGNFNPAVTVMLVSAKKQSMKTLLPYIVAQLAGGFAALEVYKRIH